MSLDLPNYARRRALDRGLRGVIVGASLLAGTLLLLVVGAVIFRGAQSIVHMSFFTQAADTPALGGVLHGIVGTLLITLTALTIAFPIGLLAGIFLAEYPQSWLSSCVRFCSDVLDSAPSIVLGAVVYLLIVQRFQSHSGLAGSIALVLLMVPTITRATEQMLTLVPRSVREAAMAMGAPMWYTTLTVVLPAAFSGISSSALLAFARGAGEAAPLLLTIQSSDRLSFALLEPIAALPLLTYQYGMSDLPAENQLAWGTALLLMLLVLGVNLLVRWAARRIGKGA